MLTVNTMTELFEMIAVTIHDDMGSVPVEIKTEDDQLQLIVDGIDVTSGLNLENLRFVFDEYANKSTVQLKGWNGNWDDAPDHYVVRLAKEAVRVAKSRIEAKARADRFTAFKAQLVVALKAAGAKVETDEHNRLYVNGQNTHYFLSYEDDVVKVTFSRYLGVNKWSHRSEYDRENHRFPVTRTGFKVDKIAKVLIDICDKQNRYDAAAKAQEQSRDLAKELNDEFKLDYSSPIKVTNTSVAGKVSVQISKTCNREDAIKLIQQLQELLAVTA